ncbi:MAG: VCBS repeat-containing protein, partial [Planctomycetes bacterium]|nr:VCBS repeat-containing protein [Planctomycetota bacterium]
MHRFPPPVLTVLLVVPMSIGIWSPAPALGDKPDFVTAMNIGKAYLENRNSAKAVETFRDIVNRFPESATAHRNLARAYLLALKTENAIEALARAAELDPESTATNYLTGIAYARLSRFAEALPYFETAVRFDPTTAALRFQLANVYQNTEQHDKSIEQLKETIRIDPLHASAYYRLGSYARKAGNRDEFQKRYREFMRLRKLFGDETRSTEALERCAYTLPEPPPIDPAHRAATVRERSRSIEVRFTDRTDEAFAGQADRTAAAAAVIDVDETGRCTLFVAAPDGACSLLKMSAENKFQRVPIQPKLTRLQNVSCCIVGDFHDDVPEEAKYDPKVHAHNDVLLITSGKLHLLKRTGPQTFEDVTQQARLSELTGRRAAWIDYDHDGDLDLFVAGDEGLEVRQNNGDGRFESVTTDVGITSTGPTLDVVGVDLDSNIAVDVVATRGDQPTVVFENQRAGRFAPMPEPPGPWPAARRILVDDVNNDGHPDAILIADKEATILLGQTPDRQRIDLSGLDVASAVLIDFDNDGWLDLCAVGAKHDNPSKGTIRLWRNLAGEDWEDVTVTTGLAAIELPPLREALTADLDVDGDTDLLLITADQRLKYIRNDGGNANGQLKIRLIAIKSNPSSLGTHIEWRKGESWVTRTVSRLPIEIGLGDLKQLDTIQTIWTNGVVDNQIGVIPTLQPLTIIEKNVRTGSCPFLFAWDGRRFRFVTDVLGNSPLGISLRRDVILPADPDELVVIGNAETLVPRAGSYELELATCFREVLYLDHVRLVAVDHDPDVEIHVTDKLMPPPFPPSELWALRSSRPLIRAIGDDGIDRTEAVRAIDDVYAPPGRLLPSPYRGMCYPMSLTLDFGKLDVDRPLVLALTGWLRYGDASANIAMSQNPSL